MRRQPIKKIIIAGGGTAGWMTAAALSHHFAQTDFTIVLVESEAIGTVGVGESTIPPIRDFNRWLGIDEAHFVRATQATFKLGIRFLNWAELGNDYIHPFGPLGHDINGVDFHHYWLRAQTLKAAAPLDDYSVAAVAARAGKFQLPLSDERSLLSRFSYSYHFDAILYARFLRDYAAAKGVERVEGLIQEISIDPDTGNIASLQLDNDRSIAGDLFIDCTGFQALLMNRLEVPFDDWSRWLPCDRAVVAPSLRTEAQFFPFTQASAQAVGWQWKIPLQHRTGNGYVFASDHLTDAEAVAVLRGNIEGELLAEPRFLSFKAGQRTQNWAKNCIAVGLAGGFLEPLESTSIYLIQFAIQKLVEYFPDAEFCPDNRLAFNGELDAEYLKLRDFIIMHYKETRRTDSPFWRAMSTMSVPESLAHRQALFASQGYVDPKQYGVYAAVCLGQGLLPRYQDVKIAQVPEATITNYLAQLRAGIAAEVAQMPDAQGYIAALHAIQGSQ